MVTVRLCGFRTCGSTLYLVKQGGWGAKASEEGSIYIKYM